MIWVLSHRFDRRAVTIADRHYNRQKIGTPQFVAPGRCLVLLSTNALWVTSWPYPEFTKHAWAGSWVNSLFRREGGSELASDMIRQGVAATRWYFGGAPSWGMVSFIDPSKIRKKRDPGRCYLKAGFRLVGRTKSGLLTFQMLPEDMPEPEQPKGTTQDLFHEVAS